MFTPSKEQNTLLENLVYFADHKEPLVAVIAPAGTGKTSCLHHFYEQSKGLREVTVCASTNKACTVLHETIPQAITLHQAVSVFKATKFRASLDRYYDDLKLARVAQLDKRDVVVPESITRYLLTEKVQVEDLWLEEGAKAFLAAKGIDGYDPLVFDGYYVSSDKRGGVIIIDEASMLPAKGQYEESRDGEGVILAAIGLDNILGVYDTVILVGDDMQLPPIKGKGAFTVVDDEHVLRLTENHRSDKSLLRLLEYTRQGNPLHYFKPLDSETGVRVMPESQLPAALFDRKKLIKLNAVHLVYKNKTRQALTRRIREGLDNKVMDGEPLVFKGKSVKDVKGNVVIARNETGSYDGKGRSTTWKSGHTRSADITSFDEYQSGYAGGYNAHWLQFGYVITTHTAQGSAWDWVFVHVKDIPGCVNHTDAVKWCYTAVSRSRHNVIIVL